MKKILKDPVSALSHLLGAILSIIGLIFLIIYSVKYGEVWDIVSSGVFGASLILLYSASTIYHSFSVSEKTTKILRKIDHIMIYILIAGTYTPICLGPLRGGWGWSVFGIVWAIAIAGVFLKIFWLNAPRWLYTSTYLIMGWIVLIAVYPMIVAFKEYEALSSLLWLLAGGVMYTIGAVIYALKWPKINNKYFGFHDIFHIFVLLGSLAHFYFIINYVIKL